MSPAPPVVPRVLALVQAGGRGGRLDVLTRERPKPVLPYAGTHALIDFALSALVHSGIEDVWVGVQYQAAALDEHLAGGRPFDLDRTRGGFRRMVPEEGSGSPQAEGFSRGNADDLFRLRDQITAHDADVLIVMSADHVFSLDLRPVVHEHLRREAEATIVTAEVGVQEAGQKLVVKATRSGRVTGVRDKPDRPAGGLVSTEIVLYHPEVLVHELDRLRRELGTGSDTGLGDFGEHLLPALVRRGRVRTYPMPGYWRDVGRPSAYLQAHRDLLTGRVDAFDHPDRPVLGRAVPGPPGLAVDGCVLEQVLLSPGSRAAGTVRRSTIGPGAVVERGAVVEDSVLLAGCVVQAGARVSGAVLDTGVRVGRDARVGEPVGTRFADGRVVLLGRDATVRGGTSLPAGAPMEPGSTT